MNDRPLSPAPSLLSQPFAEEPSLPVEERALRDDDGDGGLDKYDISTLACTD
jgi:hypothetical protein